MSGEIHSKVVHHGPEDHRAYAVAAVIAEDMHHDADTALLSTAQLVKRTRLGRTSVVAGVKILREQDWVRYFPGGGRSVASRYQLRVAEMLSTCSDECEHTRFSTCSETCRHATRIGDNGESKRVATRHELDLNVSPRDLNVSPRDNSTVSVKATVNTRATKSAIDGTLDGSLVSVDDLTRDDRETAKQMHHATVGHLLARYRPVLTKTLERAYVELDRLGIRPAEIRDHIDDGNDFSRIGRPDAFIAGKVVEFVAAKREAPSSSTPPASGRDRSHVDRWAVVEEPAAAEPNDAFKAARAAKRGGLDALPDREAEANDGQMSREAIAELAAEIAERRRIPS